MVREGDVPLFLTLLQNKFTLLGSSDVTAVTDPALFGVLIVPYVLRCIVALYTKHGGEDQTETLVPESGKTVNASFLRFLFLFRFESFYHLLCRFDLNHSLQSTDVSLG